MSKWNKKDKLLFNIINKFGNKNAIKKLKGDTPGVNPIGLYDNGKFIWFEDMNKILYSFIKKHYLSVFRTTDTIKKLCQHTITLDNKDQYVIPFIYQLLNKQFTVVCLEGENSKKIIWFDEN